MSLRVESVFGRPLHADVLHWRERPRMLTALFLVRSFYSFHGLPGVAAAPIYECNDNI